MNKSQQVLILVILAFSLLGCHKDKDLENKEPRVSNVEVTPAVTFASFSWAVEFAGQFQTGVELSEHEDMTDLRRVEATKQEGKYVAVVENLKASTQYYYRIVVWNKFNNYEEETKDFTTPAQTYTVSVSSSPVEGGMVTGGGTFTEGETCKVTATAELNYSFVNWTENGNQVSTEQEYTFTVTSNKTLVANFTSQEYTITATAEPEEGGTVSGSGGYNYGDECTLTATANEGYDFINWTKNGVEISTNTTYTFTVTETAEYVAHFQIQSYTISVAADPENGGTVEGGGTYEYGQTCTVKATEANGYHFVNWTENGGQVSSNAEYTFTVNGNRSLVANFSAEDYIISVEIEPENGGTVTGAGGYNYGDECTLTAIANEGYDFTEWTQNGTQVSTELSFSFTVTESASYKAHFTAKSYTINVSAEPSNGGSVTGSGDYHYGEECTLTATPNEGYDFDHWTKDGSQISGGATINFTVTANATYVANFNPKSYTITTQSNPTYGGTVSGGGVYTYGQNCTLTATTSDGYSFSNWTTNGGTVSTDSIYSFIVTSNLDLTANFIYTGSSTAPQGAINGKFTINANGDKVWFSKGNLEYFGPIMSYSESWYFSSNQWDYLGGSSSYNGTGQSNVRDLFGWGTSGWDNGNTYYHPWDTDNSNGSLYGPAGYHNLTDVYANADWGVFNTINYASNQAGQWRTLTKEEWKYVIDIRSTSSGIRYAKAKVHDVNGLILLPDDWDASYHSLNETNSLNASFSSNVIYYSDWNNDFEAHGAVFLPAAGYRNGGTVIYAGSYGRYWSASYYTGNSAYELFFNDSNLTSQHPNTRNIGCSVRLVCPAR